MSLQTRYDFTLPRGYLDAAGVLHREGTMRLATARDELEPLRDPTVDGPDDPRLTVVVLARVVERLGTLELVTTREIESLFAADLAFLQDFYGVINFGSQAEYEELLAAQRDAAAPVTASPAPVPQPEPEPEPPAPAPVTAGAPATSPRFSRSAIEEIPSDGR
ncbi:hypothetical protein FHE66_12205 [Georgenia sp. 311]|uniref:Tail assembly chaperone n=1 Tax=Georgenia wutianyii TaxID=2585135 RepID=A0ABX5VKX7_9MICO|nr:MULTISPECIES: hypothetical protein [Georgenia]QDB79126.1 hypothetical protein FE251_06880 [Georgenia wutianyii]TNC17054.1 hypothetical protein FHE66_12205 [Georgenia sp. 311]